MLCLARQQPRCAWARNFESSLVSRSHNPLLKTQVRSRWWNVKKERDLTKAQEREAAWQEKAHTLLREITARKEAEIKAAPTSFNVPVISITTGESTGTIELDKEIFGSEVRNDIMQRVVVWKLACKRKGLAKGKNRGEMRGTKHKVGRQKGSGRARVGQRRSPVRRGGGKAFPPVQRDYSYTLPKKVRRFGLRSALAAKFSQNRLVIAQDFTLDTWKTKNFQKIINARGWRNALFVDYWGKGPDGNWIGSNVNFVLAARNIPNIKTCIQKKANVYDILKHKYLILNHLTLDYFKQRIDGTLPRINKRAIRQRVKKLAKLRMLEAQAKRVAKEAEKAKAATE